MFKDILPAVYTIVVNWKANMIIHIDYSSSTTIESLELRRLYNDITMVYKSVH